MSTPDGTCPSCGASYTDATRPCPSCGKMAAGALPVVGGACTAGFPPFVWAFIGAAAVLAVILIAILGYGIVSKVGGRPSQPAGAADSGASGAGQEAGEQPVTPPPDSNVLISGTFRCRRGAEFDVSPEDAIVTIDGVVIGKADDFDGKGGGKTYEFRGPGAYVVKLSMRGYRTAYVQVIVSPQAAEEVVSVDKELKER